MSETDDWIEQIRSLAEPDLTLLGRIAEGLTDVQIAEGFEGDVKDEVGRIAASLSLGPFDSYEECRSTLGAIYREYYQPGAVAPAAAPRTRSASAGGGKKMAQNGVILEIPPDTVSIDVLSGAVPHDGIEGESIKRAIETRRARGLLPTYLVLTPSHVDPSMVSYRLVFFERERTESVH